MKYLRMDSLWAIGSALCVLTLVCIGGFERLIQHPENRS